MKLNVLDVYNNLDNYVAQMEKSQEKCEELWEKYAIEPYWNTLCQWAPFDMSNRKPKPIRDISKLKEQLSLLKQLNVDKLLSSFMRITNALPSYDDDPMYIAIYPLSDDEITVKERQNGVLGTCTFGNMLIRVNPLAEDYAAWIPYVFAHEYHHNIWGGYWHVIHGGELKGEFIESMLTDGQADAFALSLNPTLKPKWIFDMTPEKEKQLWKECYSKLIYKTDVDYIKYMFGADNTEIPWCASYALGYKIIASFIANHPKFTFHELLEMHPENIMKESGYPSNF